MIRQLLEQFEGYEFEELKAEVQECTEYNCTTEALLSIANYYNLDEFAVYFNELLEYQNSPKYQGLSGEQAAERLNVQHKMFDILKDQIGEEKAKELYSCL